MDCVFYHELLGIVICSVSILTIRRNGSPKERWRTTIVRGLSLTLLDIHAGGCGGHETTALVLIRS
jgi:hypothetical protein